MEESVAIYLRVSTFDQSVEAQRRELLEYTSRRGWSNVEIFEDVGVSGSHGNRPQFKAMLDKVRRRQIKTIVSWRMDRLFRSLREIITLLQEFQDVGCTFISLKENLDLSTPSGRLLTHLLASFGEFELATLKERTLMGIRNARAKGKRLGRPPRLDHQKIRVLRAEGKSLSAIAREVGTSKSVVGKTLQRMRVVKVENH